jgi:pimeloyl-ACP methyl ester carboxylesterase
MSSAVGGFVLLALLLLGGCATPQRVATFTPYLGGSTGAVAVISVTGDGLEADFFYRPAGKPQKALILLGGSEGGKSWSDDTAYIQQLLGEGCCVLSLAYFGTEGLPGQLRGIPLEYFAKAFRWLSVQKQVVPDDYTLMGVSRGAELALLLGTLYPHQVKAVVAIAPSSVVFPGPPTGVLDALRGQHSAWSFGGQEVAFVPIPYSLTTVRGMITGERTRMFEKALQNGAAVERAAIPVEKMQGPILLVSFTKDQVWPSTLMAKQMMQRLSESRFPFPYQHEAYETTHSNWSMEPCRTNILGFLREQFSSKAESPASVTNPGGADASPRAWTRPSWPPLLQLAD